MRKTFKNFRIAYTVQTTFIVKFSARLDTKNFPLKSRPSGGSIRFRNRNFCVTIIYESRRKISTPWNWFETSPSVIKVFFSLHSPTPSRANKSITSQTKSKSVFFEKYKHAQEKLWKEILWPQGWCAECSV